MDDYEWAKRRTKRIVGFIIAFPVAILVLILCVAVTMSLWNWLLPALFGWKEITFWQALGLLFLSRLLFGGLRHRSGGPPWAWRRRRRWERWEQMTPEERERFREGMRRHRCGGFSEPPPAPAPAPPPAT